MKKITTAKKSPLKIFDTYRERVNNKLKAYLRSERIQKSNLNDVMSYSVLAGGKRFRPILTYTTACLYDIYLINADACACAF